MRYGYIAALVLFALIWVAAVFVPGGRGEAMMAINTIACMSVAMLTYLTTPISRS